MIVRDEDAFGTICYRLDGKWLHRPNGPAVEWSDNSGFWMLFGVLHRYYGCYRHNWGDNNWYIHGVQIK